MSTKRNALTLRHKVDLIKAAEWGKYYRQLADDCHIGQTQANSILKRKTEQLLFHSTSSRNVTIVYTLFCIFNIHIETDGLIKMYHYLWLDFFVCLLI